jgi:membrane protease YdiL (CAAX protease family)
MLVAIAGTVPRNLFFAANLRYYPTVPWAAPVTAVYVWFFWLYLNGSGAPRSTSDERRRSLRARAVSWRGWLWALIAGGLGIIALVLGLRLANRMVVLPQQQLPDALRHIPQMTVLSLLLIAAPVAGVIEEAAFRGYMQGAIERTHGLAPAILVTGTMFAVAHLDFTWILWPYYLAVAAIYGTVTYLTNSTLPAIVLHTAGNLYSNLDLWLHGQAEWQTSSAARTLIWKTGADSSFWACSAGFVIVAALTVVAFVRLAATVGNVGEAIAADTMLPSHKGVDP